MKLTLAHRGILTFPVTAAIEIQRQKFYTGQDLPCLLKPGRPVLTQKVSAALLQKSVLAAFNEYRRLSQSLPPPTPKFGDFPVHFMAMPENKAQFWKTMTKS